MELDDATKNLVEAKHVLDPEVRKKMKIESHLGELTDLAILQHNAEKIKGCLSFLKEQHPTNNTFDDVPDLLQKEIEKFTPKPKPKIVEKKEEPPEEKPEMKTEMIAGESVDILKVPRGTSVQRGPPLKLRKKRSYKKRRQ